MATACKSSLSEPQCEFGLVFTVKEDSGEGSHSVKDETGEDSLTLRKKAGENWFW
ncbi:hypothetical protein KIN20_025456 [Parelaphostrongylus tenuis]|uniref:Uncharacterized protein n=1 Tax=Parelaphostrongylus tenuis TaxID=148309 RepID=A0AAD5QUF7_PARTN|nr:hypothetical protein KIN20_025456 [Parelaphostrongylus tenuis]